MTAVACMEAAQGASEIQALFRNRRPQFKRQKSRRKTCRRDGQVRKGAEMKVLIDTNMMLVPHQFGVDIFEFLREYEIFTLSSCASELKKLSREKGDDGIAAR